MQSKGGKSERDAIAAWWKPSAIRRAAKLLAVVALVLSSHTQHTEAGEGASLGTPLPIAESVQDVGGGARRKVQAAQKDAWKGSPRSGGSSHQQAGEASVRQPRKSGPATINLPTPPEPRLRELAPPINRYRSPQSLPTPPAIAAGRKASVQSTPAYQTSSQATTTRPLTLNKGVGQPMYIPGDSVGSLTPGESYAVAQEHRQNVVPGKNVSLLSGSPADRSKVQQAAAYQQSLAEMAIPGLGGPTPAPQVQSPASSRASSAAESLLNLTDDVGRAPSASRSNELLPDSVNAEIQARMESALNAVPGGTSTQARQPNNGSADDALMAIPGVSESSDSWKGRAPTADTFQPKQAESVPAVEVPQTQPSANSGGGLEALPPSLFEQSGGTGRAAPAPIPGGPMGVLGPNAGAKQTLDKSGKPKPLKAPKYSGLPEYIEPYGQVHGPHTDTLAKQVPYDPYSFIPSPMAPCPRDPYQESMIYRGKFPVPVQRPLIELWRPLFSPGLYPPAKNWFGRYNLVMPHFMVYGDFRTGVGVNRNQAGDANSLAFRANLDMDLEITATERIHAFMGPLDRAGDFTRLDFTDSAEFVLGTDMRLDTLFFEGDAGAIWGGLTDQDSPFDLPFSFGLLPFFYQNGIWANDAALGAAVAIPAKHSRLLTWSNFDATFFWASDQVTTNAFAGDNNAAEFFGTAWFIEAYDGYWEVDYAFVHDDVGEHRSYHNFSVAFTKRYFHRLSNSIRFITNFNQSLPRDQRTAEGHLLLIENALITKTPNTLVPYFNFWYGQGNTRGLARAAGGILNNTGINFESDGLTGYPTLDASGVNTVGGAVGVNLLGHNFNQQLILEVAGLSANGSQQFRNAAGDQYAVGLRYQKPLSNAWIFRTDHMFGFLRGQEDIRGNRVELRFKF